MISAEPSYRATRALWGSLAAIFLFTFIPLVYTMLRGFLAFCPNNLDNFWQLTKTMEWLKLCPGALFFMVFYHMASHSHSRLALIRHLKTHLQENEEKCSEPAA
jgi:hypothetical protein